MPDGRASQSAPAWVTPTFRARAPEPGALARRLAERPLGPRRRLIMGNWKSHKSLAESRDWLEALPSAVDRLPSCELVVFPPATALSLMAGLLASSGRPVSLGAQTLSADPAGAHTGELTAEMLADAGARYVLIGHSERRSEQHETPAVTRAKFDRALAAGLTPVLCIGESREERLAHRTARVLDDQLGAVLGDRPRLNTPVVLAWEPVWAIGTGLVPKLSDLAEAAELVARSVERFGHPDLPLLYGGSVKRDNARELLSVEGYDGLLIGGAALDPGHLADIALRCGGLS